ncbi:MAG TPA: hypothetical protein VF698_08260 [Thermoanaerobaculia bacterium]
MNRPRVPIGLVLRRGLRKRCPRCGEGALFRRRIESFDRCPACGVLYQRNFGDIWIFVILTDRLPILVGVIAVWFGFQSRTPLITVAFFALLIIPLVVTIRERQGLAIALDYLWRIYMPDPSDEIHDGREWVVGD